MTMFALVTGTISTAPTRRTTSKGAAWVTFQLRAQSGEGSAYVNVAVFDSGLVEAAQALVEGNTVSACKAALSCAPGRAATVWSGRA